MPIRYHYEIDPEFAPNDYEAWCSEKPPVLRPVKVRVEVTDDPALEFDTNQPPGRWVSVPRREEKETQEMLSRRARFFIRAFQSQRTLTVYEKKEQRLKEVKASRI